MQDEQLTVVDEASRRRYELRRGDEVVGVATYRSEPGRLFLDHVEVEPDLRGRGLGSRLLAGVLEDVRSRGLFVTPVCPFAVSYLERHPEERNLVARHP